MNAIYNALMNPIHAQMSILIAMDRAHRVFMTALLRKAIITARIYNVQTATTR